jgi:hypothetical protein
VNNRWSPRLELRESAGRCRLSLAGLTHGDGQTLQEAADDLISRISRLVMVYRASGVTVSLETGCPDPELLDFVWELGERAARGEDIRERIFDATIAPS